MTEQIEQKRNRLAKKTVSESGDTVTFTFGDGTVRTIGYNDIPEPLRVRFAVHGLSQKLGDSYAGEKDAASALAEYDGTLAQIMAGQWHAERTSAGPKIGKTVSVCFRMFTDNGKFWRKLGAGADLTIENVRAWVANLKPEQKSAVIRAPEYLQAAANIATDDAAKGTGSIADLLK